jgi:hypothetical protein
MKPEPKVETKPSKEPKVPMWDFLEDETRNLDGTTTMVYRLEPVISRPARQHCIGQHVGCFSRDQVFREYGSGVYQFYVKDANKKPLYTESSSFHNLNYPPKLDPLELVISDPKNQPYLQMFKKATESKSPSAADAARKDDIAEILRAHSEGNKVDPQVISWLQDLGDKRDVLAAKLAEASARNPTADFAELVKAVKDLMPDHSASVTVDPLAIVDKVLSIQNRAETDVEKVWKLVERAQGRAQPAEAPNPINTIKETLGMVSQFKELFKSEVSPTVITSDGMGLEGWQALTSSVMQSLPEALKGFAAVVSAFKSGTPPPAAPPANVPPAAPRPGGFDPYKDMAAAREYARSQNAAATSASQPGNPQQGSVPNPSAAPGAGFSASANAPDSAPQQAAGMDPVLALLTSAISCLQRGVSGYRFADSVIVMHNELEYEAIVNQIEVMTIPAIVAMAKGVPQIGDYVTRYEPQFIRFVEEFIAGPDAEDGEDDSEQESRSINGLDRGSKPKPVAVP